MQPRFEKLPNGLKVVLAHQEAESLAFGLFVESGSRHEDEAHAGISHLIEHMLFKGTTSRSALDITLAVEGRGGRFNAYTSEECTCYYAHMPSEYLVEAVELLSDMYTHAALDAKEFAREKSVVLEEIKMYEDEPDTVAIENLQRALFPKHPLGRSVAGSAKSLAPLRPADLKSWIRTHYLPSRTTAVVVGSFDDEQALAEIRRRLGRGGGKASRFTQRRPAAEPVHAVTVAKDVQQAQLALGFRTFGVDDPRRFALSVLDAIMGRGMSSRLFLEVREKRGLSYDISSRAQFFQDAGLWTITAGCDVARKDEVLATIEHELRRIRTLRVSAVELKRIKEYMIGNFRLSNEKLTSKLFYYGTTLNTYHRLVPMAEQIEGIRKVAVEDVLRVAQDVIQDKLKSISWVLPK